MAQKIIIYQCEDNSVCCVCSNSQDAPECLNGTVLCQRDIRRIFNIFKPISIRLSFCKRSLDTLRWGDCKNVALISRHINSAVWPVIFPNTCLENGLAYKIK
jgi:hypothetical protein